MLSKILEEKSIVKLMELLDIENKIYLLDNDNLDFPSLDMMENDLVAIGGNFHPQRLLNAYSNGLFPWYIDDDGYIHWYCPQQRMVLKPNEFKLSKSLKRVIKNQNFTLKINENFEEVIKSCATIKRKNEADSWISDEFIKAYTSLHNLGFASSIECYLDNELVGGLYGVLIGDIFCGESMFSKVSNASKVAFYYLCDYAKENNISLIDCQVYNEHLSSLGAYEISRDEYFGYLINSKKVSNEI